MTRTVTCRNYRAPRIRTWMAALSIVMAVLVTFVFTVGGMAPTASAQSGQAKKKIEQEKPAPKKTKKPRKARKSPRKRTARGGVEMNFNNIEMSIFLSVMAEALGLPLTWDGTKIRGKITLVSSRKFRQRDALRIFETVLSMHGLTTVQTPGSPLLQVVPTATASRLPSPTRPQGRAGRRGFFRTRIISLKNADANQVRAALTPLMSKSAAMAVYAPANVLVLSDTTTNIRRLMQIIRAMDVPSEDVTFTVVKLKFAKANKLAPIVTNLSSTLPPAKTRPRQGRRPAGRVTQMAKGGGKTLKVVADERTNSLILVGSADLIRRVKEIIVLLDVQAEEISFAVLTLKFARAKNLAPIVSSLSGVLPGVQAGKPGRRPSGRTQSARGAGVKVVADERTNTLILVGEPDLIKRIKLLVTRLDIPTKKVTYAVLTLKYASAKGLEPIVSSLSSKLPSQVSGAGGTPSAKGASPVGGTSREFKVVADERTNKLILIGDPERILRIKDIVALLDVPAEEIQTVVLSLKYASARKLEPIITSLSTALPTVSVSAGGKNGDKKVSAARVSQATAFKAVADERTNTLILVGDTRLIKKFRHIISLLDVPGLVEEKGVKVITLEHADALEMVKILKGVDIKADPQGKSDAAQASSGPLSKLTITADKATNSIIIFGSAEVIETMVEMVSQLDVPRPQVYVEVLIMEMTLEKSLQLGIRWQGTGKGSDGVVGAGFPDAAPRTLATALTAGAGSVIGVVGNEITFAGEKFATFSGFIQATKQDQDINVLANPQLLTLNNQEAEINVSQVVPVSTRTITNANLQTTTEFEFKDVGIILSITPQITGKDKIRLIINQESSSIASRQTVQNLNQMAITTLKRKLKTIVVVDNDTTMAIGGLIQEQTVVTETKVPCLGDIPLVGWLFKTKSDSLRKTNLIIFIRPRIIATREDMDAATGRVRGRFDELRSPKVDADGVLRKSFGLPKAPEPEKEEKPPEAKDAPPDDAGGDN